MVYYLQDNILVFFLTEELNKHVYNVCHTHVEIIIWPLLTDIRMSSDSSFVTSRADHHSIASADLYVFFVNVSDVSPHGS